MPYDLRIGERCLVLPSEPNETPECVGHIVVIDLPLGNHFGWNRDGSFPKDSFLSYGCQCECGQDLYCAPHELRRLEPPREITPALEMTEVPA